MPHSAQSNPFSHQRSASLLSYTFISGLCGGKWSHTATSHHLPIESSYLIQPPVDRPTSQSHHNASCIIITFITKAHNLNSFWATDRPGKDHPVRQCKTGSIYLSHPTIFQTACGTGRSSYSMDVGGVFLRGYSGDSSLGVNHSLWCNAEFKNEWSLPTFPPLVLSWYAKGQLNIEHSKLFYGVQCLLEWKYNLHVHSTVKPVISAKLLRTQGSQIQAAGWNGTCLRLTKFGPLSIRYRHVSQYYGTQTSIIIIIIIIIIISDTSNHRGCWDYFKVIQKIREQHTRKTWSQGTTEHSHIGHCTHTSGSTNVKVQ